MSKSLPPQSYFEQAWQSSTSEKDRIVRWLRASGNFTTPIDQGPLWFPRSMGCLDPAIFVGVYDDGSWEIRSRPQVRSTYPIEKGVGLNQLKRSGYVK